MPSKPIVRLTKAFLAIDKKARQKGIVIALIELSLIGSFYCCCC